VQRRNLLHLLTALPASAALGGIVRAPETSPVAPPAPASTPFDADTVPAMARALAAKPYQAPDATLPADLKNLKYQEYRSIRFDTKKALWRGQGTPFQVQFFHRGFLYTDRVDIFEVAGGQAQPIRYTPDLFHFDRVQPPKVDDLGFAGLRLHNPISRPDYFDEVCTFLGASYFRAVARGQGYGLSARGLAVKTADPGGEEFPAFKSFWIEKPARNAQAIVMWALLDSQSVAASFRFEIQPGTDTIFTVDALLLPRVDIGEAGIAPLTSMFYFDANNRAGIDDYRSAVHDSSGLLMLTGHGDPLWRPLVNPTTLQFSAFGDTNPRGFGLLQRERRFSAYEDLEANYQRRPSLWVEPVGDWGEGNVDLVEIPTKEEIHDNIVAFWRPKQPLKAKGEYTFKYRLHWCWDPPGTGSLAKIMQTRAGVGFERDTRQFVIDVAGEALKAIPPDAPLSAQIDADKGRIRHAVAQHNPESGGWRISFALAPADAKVIELKARLVGADAPLSEIWLYRWTA
jgi:periplasmic glucans biosynthesis protein